MAIVQLGIMNAHPGALLVEEVVHLVEAEEDLADVADEEDDDDPDEHKCDAAVPATPEWRGGGGQKLIWQLAPNARMGIWPVKRPRPRPDAWRFHDP